MKRFLVIGSGGRESSIIKALAKENMYVFCYCKTISPFVRKLLKGVYFYHAFNIEDCVDYCKEFAIDIVIIGSEQFLVTDIVTTLNDNNIRCIAPTREHARIETDKAYARDIVSKIERHQGDVNPDYIVVDRSTSFIRIHEFLRKHENNIVIKPCGLHGGKGVKVYGDHLFNDSDIIEYITSLVGNNERVLIEEKLQGIEFSLLSITDGVNAVPMPPVQDFKRLNNGNKGPNTGSMGCVYDGANLNFLSDQERDYAQHLNTLVLNQLKNETGYGYKGFLYGSFIKTMDGKIKVIEFNARLGDPEGIILLKQLDTNFSQFSSICFAIANEHLKACNIVFNRSPALCYYLVPIGYPTSPLTNFEINTECITYGDIENIFSGAVSAGERDGIIGTGSRTFAICCSGSTMHEAQNACFTIINRFMLYNKDKFVSRTDLLKCYRRNISSNEEANASNPYLESGVDVAEGNKVVREITDIVKSTYNPNVLNEIGAFGGCYSTDALLNNYGSPVLVSSIDGVGTKSILSIEHLGTVGFYNLGHDLVNHSINDILVQGAKPLYFLDYIASSKISSDNVKSFLSGIADACKEANCAILGGETAEMPNIYTTDSHDFVGVITGVVERHKMIDGKRDIKKGDKLFALPSSGPHTNGYSLIRKLKKEHPDEFDNNLMNQLCIPHKSYLDEVTILMEANVHIHGLAHITGGGFDDNISRILPSSLSICYHDFEFSDLFQTLQRIGSLSTKTMKEVFNCGYGMIVIVDPEDSFTMRELLPESTEIGYVM